MASAGNSGSGDDDAGGKLLANRYQKGEVLGEGTYGVVFKAIDTKVPFPHQSPKPSLSDLRAATKSRIRAFASPIHAASSVARVVAGFSFREGFARCSS